jgi:CRP/FNR family transcriptional regulator, anaerobic regulatory protein
VVVNIEQRGKTDIKKIMSGYSMTKIPIFSMLEEKQLNSISDLIAHSEYKKGQVIFSQGELWNKLYIIHKGKVKIYKYTKEGKEQILYILSEGDFIGDMNLFKQSDFQFNAVALEHVVMCTLNNEEFKIIVKNNPEMTFKILEEVQDRLLNLERLIQTLSTKDVESRLASMLLSFIKSFSKETTKGIELKVPLNREDMANFIGITRETISRKLASLQEAGIIELVRGKKIIIKDFYKLKELI